MARATGLGGFFFKAQDPKQLQAWYCQHLGLKAEDYGGVNFLWRDDDAPEKRGMTVWSPFPADTKYFEPGQKPFMMNFRVDDLDGLLAKLRAAGVTVEDKVDKYDYGRFGWIMDPEGNRIELWEPPVGTAGRS
jgi:predicted enzyme related to lactoylglutathione lyase